MNKFLLYFSTPLILLSGILFISDICTALSTPWVNPFNNQRIFLENKGQVNGRIPSGAGILCGLDNGNNQIYFNRKGVVYFFEKKEKNQFIKE